MSRVKTTYLKYPDGQIQKREFQPDGDIKTAKEFASQFGASVAKKSDYDSFQLKLDEKNKQTELQREKKQEQREAKLHGFEFLGVMCSATKEDQSGLTSVLVGFQSGLITKTPFEFENGSVLVLTQDNINDFAKKWSAFRQGFFNE